MQWEYLVHDPYISKEFDLCHPPSIMILVPKLQCCHFN